MPAIFFCGRQPFFCPLRILEQTRHRGGKTIKQLFMKIICLAILSVIALNTRAQNVGIGTTNPLEKLSVGNSSQFRVDANGNIIRINNVPYSFPLAQGAANQVLINDGAGNLVWANAPAASSPKPVVRQFVVTNNGLSSWFIDQNSDYASNSNVNPGLVLYRGLTYQFLVSAPGHPFLISTAVGSPGYTVGVTNNNITSGIVTFTVPMDAPDMLVYYCTIHTFTMNGIITIR